MHKLSSKDKLIAEFKNIAIITAVDEANDKFEVALYEFKYGNEPDAPLDAVGAEEGDYVLYSRQYQFMTPNEIIADAITPQTIGGSRHYFFYDADRNLVPMQLMKDEMDNILICWWDFNLPVIPTEEQLLKHALVSGDKNGTDMYMVFPRGAYFGGYRLNPDYTIRYWYPIIKPGSFVSEDEVGKRTIVKDRCYFATQEDGNPESMYALLNEKFKYGDVISVGVGEDMYSIEQRVELVTDVEVYQKVKESWQNLRHTISNYFDIDRRIEERIKQFTR